MFKKLFGGSRTVRHAHDDGPIEPSPDHKISALLKPYIEETFGTASTVLHEIASDGIQVDVYVIPPSDKEKRLTLVTSGMSERPMRAPKQRAQFKFAELVAFLPAA